MIIVISTEEIFKDEHDLINSLFNAGMPLLHLRKFNHTAEELSALIRKIKPEYYSRIALNNFHETAGQFGINRLHFSEQDRKMISEEQWKELKNGNYILSTSIHELGDREKLSFFFDYAFLSPVFDSISKPGYKAKQFDVKERSKFQTKLIALGGINEENCLIPLEHNFDGIGLSGSIWTSKNPVKTFEKISQKCSMTAL
jgi:thiamine-phosphate pyrophosphorylase